MRAGSLQPVRISFEGANVQAGDRAKWVRADAADCGSAHDATPWTTTQLAASSGEGEGEAAGTNANVTARFIFPSSSAGMLVLCYRFGYLQQAVPGQVKPTTYLLFPAIRVVAVRFDSVVPSATGIGCSSQLTVSGSGFAPLLSLLAAGHGGDGEGVGSAASAVPTCGFGAAGASTATIVNDTTLICVTPAPSSAGALPMRVDAGDLTTHIPTTFPDFAVFDAASYVVTSLWPTASAYNLEPVVHMRGSFGLPGSQSYGTPRCRFGNWTSSPLENSTASNHRLNATQLTCRKPLFPYSVRDAVGAYPVAFSPNGQCWPPRTSSASFITYNAQVDSIRVSGSPSTSSMALDVIGQGFVLPALPNGACRFTRQSSGAEAVVDEVTSEVEILSTTLARCAGTPSGRVEGVWRVEVLQNGVNADPSAYPVMLTTYDLAAVRVSSLDPPSGPAGVETAVTVNGRGFAQYGEGQLVCRVGDNLSPATLLDTNRTTCTIPPLAASMSVGVTISLNNGTFGTFSADNVVFTAYTPPYIASVLPAAGKATGGTVVTVYGNGFGAAIGLSADASARVVCKFGGEQAPAVAASSFSDSQVVCVTPWGAGEGQPVRVALNGVSFALRRAVEADSPLATIEEVPKFAFVGLHPPALLEAFFTQDATTLVIRFDTQPTNRGGMNGVEPCTAVLDDATSAQLKGTAMAEADCYWTDDSTLVARLTAESLATGGMTIGLRPRVLWPKLWVYPGSCDLADSMCATGGGAVGSSIAVDPDFPCDTSQTAAARELCVVPSALIQAPNQIDSCPGTSVSLDATRSSGGGVRPLAYSWSAHPRTSDNYYQIAAKMAASGTDISVLNLGSAELDGGSAFNLMLVVTSCASVPMSKLP